MIRLDVVWYLMLLLVIFFGANISLLRLSCELANCIGHWCSGSTQIRVPTFRTCFAIVLAASIIVVGLINASTNTGLSAWGVSHIGAGNWNMLASMIQWFGFASVVGLGISDEQQAPRRLVIIAALFHTFLLIGILSLLPRFIT